MLTIPVVVGLGWKFHRSALRAARHGSTTMDTLVSLGSMVALVDSVALTVVSPTEATLFDVAALIVTLISLGKLLELVARARAADAIEGLAGRQPAVAHLVARASAARAPGHDGPPVDVAVESLRVGDVVLVRPGDLVGSARWVEAEGVTTAATEHVVAAIVGRAQTPVLVAVDGEVCAVLAIADPVRPESAAAVRRLRTLGLHVVLASGDVDATVRAVAARVGIDEVHAQLRPEDKSALVDDLRRRLGTVAMVGDGINDAPALARADVGIAIGTGTGVAVAAADITLVQGDIAAVASAIELSRATLRVIRQNLAWAFGYNLVLVPLAATGILPPIGAALAMAFSSLSVVLNALRLRRFGARSRPAPTPADAGARLVGAPWPEP